MNLCQYRPISMDFNRHKRFNRASFRPNPCRLHGRCPSVARSPDKNLKIKSVKISKDQWRFDGLLLSDSIRFYVCIYIYIYINRIYIDIWYMLLTDFWPLSLRQFLRCLRLQRRGPISSNLHSLLRTWPIIPYHPLKPDDIIINPRWHTYIYIYI